MKEAYAQSIECEEPCGGDFHARFCERVRVKLPRSTRPMILVNDIRCCILHLETPNIR